MSFQRRLLASLLLILIVPVGAIGLLLLRLPGEQREGTGDARLAGALPPVLNRYEGRLDQARDVARQLARDPGFVRLLAERNPGVLETAISDVARARGLHYAEVRDPGGASLAVYERGGHSAATASVSVRNDGRPLGTILVSTLAAQRFARQTANSSELEAVLAEDGEPVAASLDPAGVELSGDPPFSEDLELNGIEFRARVVELPDARGDLSIALLGPRGSAELTGGQAAIGVLLGAFVLLALGLIAPLLRQLQQAHARTEQEAGTDDLTGLANQRRFRESLEREIRRAERFDHTLSLLMLDLDNFKKVNDEHGHLRGDEVLRHFAELLAAESREVDEPARYGGEEFAVILPETDVAGAAEMAERLRLRVERARMGDGSALRVTVSVGVASLPEHARDHQALIAAADSALYEAKRAGRNRVVTADEGNA